MMNHVENDGESSISIFLKYIQKNVEAKMV